MAPAGQSAALAKLPAQAGLSAEFPPAAMNREIEIAYLGGEMPGPNFLATLESFYQKKIEELQQSASPAGNAELSAKRPVNAIDYSPAGKSTPAGSLEIFKNTIPVPASDSLETEKTKIVVSTVSAEESTTTGRVQVEKTVEPVPPPNPAEPIPVEYSEEIIEIHPPEVPLLSKLGGTAELFLEKSLEIEKAEIKTKKNKEQTVPMKSIKSIIEKLNIVENPKKISALENRKSHTDKSQVKSHTIKHLSSSRAYQTSIQHTSAHSQSKYDKNKKKSPPAGDRHKAQEHTGGRKNREINEEKINQEKSYSPPGKLRREELITSGECLEKAIWKNREKQPAGSSASKTMFRGELGQSKEGPFYGVSPLPNSVPPAGLPIPMLENRLYRPAIPIFPPSRKWVPIPWSPPVSLRMSDIADSIPTPTRPVKPRTPSPLEVPLNPAQPKRRDVIISVPSRTWITDLMNALDDQRVGKIRATSGTSFTAGEINTAELFRGSSQRAVREPKRNVFAPHLSSSLKTPSLLDPRRFPQYPVGGSNVEEIIGQRVLVIPADTSLAAALAQEMVVPIPNLLSLLSIPPAGKSIESKIKEMLKQNPQFVTATIDFLMRTATGGTPADPTQRNYPGLENRASLSLPEYQARVSSSVASSEAESEAEWRLHFLEDFDTLDEGTYQREEIWKYKCQERPCSMNFPNPGPTREYPLPFRSGQGPGCCTMGVTRRLAVLRGICASPPASTPADTSSSSVDAQLMYRPP